MVIPLKSAQPLVRKVIPVRLVLKVTLVRLVLKVTLAAGAKGDTGDKGEDGTSFSAEVVNNGDGTHTITVTNESDGSVTTLLS